MRRRSLRDRIEERARRRCEYCLAPQDACGYRFHLEHILPATRGGGDEEPNRAQACASCNLAKSDRVSAPDPLTGTETPLFNPRAQNWPEHFRWNEDQWTLTDLTAVGRATISALDLNSELRQRARPFWLAAGLLPL